MIGGFQVGAFQPLPAYQQQAATQPSAVGGSGAWWKAKGRRTWDYYLHEPMLETLADVYRLIEEEKAAEEARVEAKQTKRRENQQRAQKAAEVAGRNARDVANYIRAELARQNLHPPAMPKTERVDTAKFWAFAREMEEIIRRRQQQWIDDDDDDILDILNSLQ